MVQVNVCVGQSTLETEDFKLDDVLVLFYGGQLV